MSNLVFSAVPSHIVQFYFSTLFSSCTRQFLLSSRLQCVICPKKGEGRVCQYMHARAIHNALTQGRTLRNVVGTTLPTPQPRQITPCIEQRFVDISSKIQLVFLRCCLRKRIKLILHFSTFFQIIDILNYKVFSSASLTHVEIMSIIVPFAAVENRMEAHISRNFS